MMSNARFVGITLNLMLGIEEVKRKFSEPFITLIHFYLYANIDRFTYSEKEIDINERTEIDRWIISELNTNNRG